MKGALGINGARALSLTHPVIAPVLSLQPRKKSELPLSRPLSHRRFFYLRGNGISRQKIKQFPPAKPIQAPFGASPRAPKRYPCATPAQANHTKRRRST